MKRTLSSSILKKKLVKNDAEGDAIKDEMDPTSSTEPQSEPTSGIKPRLGGAGSAWKAGALSDAGQILKSERQLVVERIMLGQQELQLNADQIIDKLGTDRREDWRDQESFQKTKTSIEQHGQDTPIQVWPEDPDWRPDEREPTNVDGIKFELIVGRRRTAILEALGQPIRAILVPQRRRGTNEEQFELLFMRFRENEERENLSAFERLVAIGEMFEGLQSANPDDKLTAITFAKRVGVHESVVSRGRAVFNAKDQILHACKNVYSLSHRELEKVLNDLSDKVSRKSKKKPTEPQKLMVQRQIGSKKLSLTGQGGKLSVNATGMNMDKKTLEGLGDVIAKYLSDKGVAK